jgi:hypothetical protein
VTQVYKILNDGVRDLGKTPRSTEFDILTRMLGRLVDFIKGLKMRRIFIFRLKQATWRNITEDLNLPS